MRKIRILFTALLLVVLVPGLAYGQSSSTANLTGTVTDQKGAAVPGASIELINSATNESRTQTTGDTGYYTFVNVPPGSYKVVIKKSGFRTTTINPVGLQVGKSFTIDAKLELGTVAETIEVVAGGQAELQTQDASVGNVIERKMLDNIPSLGRDATALLLLQPLATPGFNSPGSPNATGEGDNTGGQIAGARSDQNTFLLDGGDATDSTAGGGQYSGGNFTATPRAVVPTPIESLEEFRVVTTNSTASFSRSAGHQSVPRCGLRIPPEQRPERQHLGSELQWHSEPGTARQPLWRTYWRTDLEGQDLFLCSLRGAAFRQLIRYSAPRAFLRYAARNFTFWRHGVQPEPNHGQ